MMYGKETAWLEGIKVDEEPERLSAEQSVRGYTLLRRVFDFLGDMEKQAISVIADKMSEGEQLSERDVKMYNLFATLTESKLNSELEGLLGELGIGLINHDVSILRVNHARINPYDLEYLGL
jgi:hypothetical protein